MSENSGPSPRPRPASRPSGRRRGGRSTREAILEAAVTLFAERGYAGTTLRAVTAAAGVDVALVSHFFGGKEGLFEEAVLKRSDRNLHLLMRPRPGDSPAQRLLEAYVAMWEDPETALTIRALIRAALESEESRRRVHDLVSGQFARAVLAVSQEGLGHGAVLDPQLQAELELRGQLLAAHLFGIGIARYLLELSPVADVTPEALIARMTPVVEALFVGVAGATESLGRDEAAHELRPHPR